MEARSLQSDSKPRRKRSFTLSSFRKPAGEQQLAETNATAAEEIARIRKAAAWQWYTRGLGEVVVPTKRPIPGDTLAGGAAAAVRGLVQPKGGEKSSIEKKCSGAKDRSPAAADTRRAASRFKAEASARDSPESTSATTIPAGPSPLYDEFELSGLKSQMVNFVQRLQKKESEQKAAKPLHSDPAPVAPAGNHSSTQQLHPPAEGSGVRRYNSASVEGSGFRRPMSALQKLFRKVMAISFSKNNSAAVQELEAPAEEAKLDDVQYHYHHYIHHHHHHHYGGPSPEEAQFIRRRRHSESGDIRPRIPSLIWEENDVTTEEEEEEESPLSAFTSRQRRHSESFAEHNAMKKTNYEGVEWPDKEPVKPAGLQLPSWRRYNSERFTSKNEVPNVGKNVEIGEEQWQGVDIKSRRRQSTESFREGDAENVRWRMWAATEEAKARGGGGDGGGAYKLGGARVYECARRRHSESLGPRRRREENVEHMYIGGNMIY